MENQITLFNCDGLYRAAELYAQTTGLKESTVSDRAFGDWRILTNLRAGKTSITLARHNDALRWFANNWPAETTIPDDLAALRSVPAVTGVDVGREAVTQ